MSNIITLAFETRVDRDMIDAAIAAEAEISVFAANNYSDTLSADATVAVNEMDGTVLEAFKKVTDYLSYAFEAGGAVIKIAYDPETKTFDLAGSYIRNAVDTAFLPKPANGFPITVRFEFAGFIENEVVEITAPYNQAFDVDDVALLAEAGVAISGNGAGFSITNARECKVYFAKPAEEEGVYIIQYPAAETVIPASDGV